MRYSPEMARTLEEVNDHLEPGQRVPDAWEQLPLRLRDQLKVILAGSPTVEFEKAFAEFVHAHLMAFRRQEGDGTEAAGRRRA